ncbi:sigma 54-interacting transcriptional regulator [Arcobacter sp.]|uniref:sigma-54-dependent Fis family transcriptional regulator n=1 Tax=Arcobacter sp. TaxID=1872629 RepID=UPI003D0B74AA
MSLFDNTACSSCLTLRELTTLYEISAVISNHYDLKTSLEKSIKILKNSLNLTNCTVHVLEEEILSVFASVELTNIQKKLSTYKLGEGVTGVAALSKEPVVVENIHSDSLFLNKSGKRDFTNLSYVAVPLVVENETVGVLGAALTKSTEIGFEDCVRILTIIGSIFAQTIHSYQLNIKEKERLEELKSYYKMEWDSKVHNFGDIIGDSPKMQQVFQVIQRIAQSEVTILVRGETGTGKELVAAAIHKRSKRADEPFIKLNCAAITDTLLESELFGHEKGAFTDAKETRKGRFELADGGTLFLDEIGDISASAQVKLLRVLQEREFERVGGSKTIKVNVRLVAATNRNLEQMVKDGKFREDLYYRLNVIPIDLPPLRERGEDIKQLVNFFLERSMKNHKKKVKILDEAMDILAAYPWPGNVRELENTIERIVLMGNENGIDSFDMSLLLPALEKGKLEDKPIAASRKSIPKKSLDEMEKEAIEEALISNDFNQSHAAKELGITLRQIGYKINKYGITNELQK